MSRILKMPNLTLLVCYPSSPEQKRNNSLSHTHTPHLGHLSSSTQWQPWGWAWSRGWTSTLILTSPQPLKKVALQSQDLPHAAYVHILLCSGAVLFLLIDLCSLTNVVPGRMRPSFLKWLWRRWLLQSLKNTQKHAPSLHYFQRLQKPCKSTPRSSATSTHTQIMQERGVLSRIAAAGCCECWCVTQNVVACHLWYMCHKFAITCLRMTNRCFVIYANVGR